MTTQTFPDRTRALVGARDPMEILGGTPVRLGKIIASTSAEAMRARPFAGKWTANEILGHLMDHELVMGGRLRAIRFEVRVVTLRAAHGALGYGTFAVVLVTGVGFVLLFAGVIGHVFRDAARARR